MPYQGFGGILFLTLKDKIATTTTQKLQNLMKNAGGM